MATSSPRSPQQLTQKQKQRKPRRRLSGRRDDPPEVRLSKTLSYALRHGAVELGLPIRASGYVELAQLLRLPLFQSFTEEQVHEVVRTNAKKRFTITTDEAGEVQYIRANQGHSVPCVEDEQLLTPLEDAADVEICVHGTYVRHWASILSNGLSRMTRNHIHMTTAVVTGGEVISGMRSDCNLFLFIDLPRALDDGVKFYRSSNNVILSPGIGERGVLDAKYFLRAMQRDGTILFERPDLSRTA